MQNKFLKKNLDNKNKKQLDKNQKIKTNEKNLKIIINIYEFFNY